MRRKKLFKPVIAGILLASLISITACNGCLAVSDMVAKTTGAPEETAAEINVPETGESITIAEETQNETKADGETITLKLGIYPSSDYDKAYIEQHDGYISRLTTDNPSITVEKSPYFFDSDEFPSLMESGSCPTVFSVTDSDFKWLISKDYIRDITDILMERGWLDSMVESFRNNVSENDKVYGVPAYNYGYGLMVNIDLFKAAGLVDENAIPKYPSTWDELIEYSKIIRETTGKAGFCLNAGDCSFEVPFAVLAKSYGAELVFTNDDGTRTTNLDSKEAIEIMKLIRSLKWDYDILTDDPAADTWISGYEHIAAGDAAMYLTAEDALNQPVENGLGLDKFAIGPVPGGPAGAYFPIGSEIYVFPKDATDAQINAALDYLVLMGKTPVVTDEVKEGILNDAKTANEQGIPVIKPVSCWSNSELEGIYDEALEKYGNIYTSLYDAFLESSQSRENFNLFSYPHKIFHVLGAVAQEVLGDPDADVETLMKKADKEAQDILDDPDAQ